MNVENEYIVNAIINNCSIENLRGNGYIVDRKHKVKFIAQEDSFLSKQDAEELVEFLNTHEQIFSSIEMAIDDDEYDIEEVLENELIKETFILAKQNFGINYNNKLVIGIITLI